VQAEKGVGFLAIHCPAMVFYFHRNCLENAGVVCIRARIASSSVIDSDWAGKEGGVWFVGTMKQVRAAPVNVLYICLVSRG
jgi:hypothetical protein